MVPATGYPCIPRWSIRQYCVATTSKGKILNSATLEPQSHIQNQTQPQQQTLNHIPQNSTNQNSTNQNSTNQNSTNQNSMSQPSTNHHEPPIGLALAQDVRFTDFNISDSLKNRLTNANFTIPTPVQAKAIPPALEGADILATASTGTGKTLSFLIPMIDRLEEISKPSTRGAKNPILALILLPTRELAMQVLDAYFKICPTLKSDAV